MFVYSVKSGHIKTVFLVMFAVITVISLAVLSKESSSTSADGEQVFTAADNTQRLSFISNYGWEVDEEAVEVKEVVIPEELDDTYTAYNEIQKSQGFDLTLYAGRRVKRWTYIINNYEGYENRDCIRINILVCDDIIIGGDVCSVELDGFMHGFSPS